LVRASEPTAAADFKEDERKKETGKVSISRRVTATGVSAAGATTPVVTVAKRVQAAGGTAAKGVTATKAKTPPKPVRLQRTRGDHEQDSKFLKELAVDRTFFQVN